MADLLHAQGLVKRFGEFTAVNEVTMTVRSDIITSIIGPNGAGKTTLINVLTGSLPCDEGRVTLDGEDITHLPVHERVRKGISRSFQITNIFPHLTVLQNLQVPVLARLNQAGRPFARPRVSTATEVETLLKDIGLWEVRNALAGELSHGDQRLLEIGMAIASRPRLCFLDEPCSGMNPVERGQVQDLIRRLARERETTFVIVEHDMDVVFALSNLVIVMHQGSILTQGEPEAIHEHAGVREIYLGEEVMA